MSGNDFDRVLVQELAITQWNSERDYTRALRVVLELNGTGLYHELTVCLELYTEGVVTLSEVMSMTQPLFHATLYAPFVRTT
jgi:hypothetical protein